MTIIQTAADAKTIKESIFRKELIKRKYYLNHLQINNKNKLNVMRKHCVCFVLRRMWKNIPEHQTAITLKAAQPIEIAAHARARSQNKFKSMKISFRFSSFY